jgi:biopolymer transport protein ExbD
MMAKRRALRYQSAADVSSDLKQLISYYKQGRSLDLVKLPILEQLDAAAEAAKVAAAEEARRSAVESINNSDPLDEADELELAAGSEVGATMAIASTSANQAGQQRTSSRKSSSKLKTIKADKKKQASLVTVTLPSWEEEEDDDFALGRPDPDFEEMDLTPMVDVTFLLLIFFMITAAFNLQKKIDMPPATSEEGMTTSVAPPNDSTVEAEIDRDNQIYVDGSPGTTFDELVRLMEAAKTGVDNIELKVKIDPESTHEKRILVADAAAKAGFVKIKSLITEVN